MANKKTNGLPNIEEWGMPSQVAKYEPVLSWLKKKNAAPESCTTQTLYELSMGLQACQERLLGKNQEGVTRPRLPSGLFQDYQEGGFLCVILLAALSSQAEKDWKTIDLETQNADSSLTVIDSIETALVEANLLQWPVVHISSDITDPEERTRLHDIITAWRGTVTDDQSSASHVVHDAPAPAQTSDTMARLVERDSAQLLVHWLFTPDSYNSFVSTSCVSRELDPPITYVGPWRISKQYLK
eukprot:Ihof_evm5s303 gene=Ihof_evmTU5s303